MSVRTEKFEADIVLTDDGKWSLNWGDYVINETIEVYSDLALALIRLGTLVRAVDTETMFAHTNAEDFTRAANKWLTDSALEVY